MPYELPKTYNPADFEDRLYKFWEENGYFKPSGDKNSPAFSVVIPPPNVTGQLHMGHALNNTLQDILVRYKRMCGYETLWIPGTDHAGIATQIKVEEMLRKEKGLSRHDIGRDEFLKLVWEWKNKYGGRIINQLKKLGSSCDWSREAFTMNENLSRAVKKVFVSLYDKGLIYQGLRITNICPHCNTALSDAEVEHKEVSGHFWHIRYPVKGSEGEYVTVATTRPETMLGDSAVAVHPDDERYKHLVGKTLILPLMNREIPVIADDYVDREFGTGCVKITPCHDPNDFEMGQRHNLEQIIVIDNSGKINQNGGKYAGMDRFDARKAIVSDLEALGYLVKVEEHSHNVAHCYRCGSIVEPIASKQWFVLMKPLAEPAIKVVKDGDIRYIPERFSKIYLNWMENIHDWCISRQLWWGHRIPAYYCDSCGEVVVAEDAPECCPKCGKPMRQDEDVLDTWFSSALWPFSTLGWPDETEDLKRFYPTSVLVTAYDIITFWVSKMIFMGIENMGEKNRPIKEQIPFPDVFIHGLVRDEQGRKMSKSLGNGIDPLEIIGKYGADALRFALATGNSPGNDMRFSDEKIEAARNFANKIWNASRFVLMNLDIEKAELPDDEKLSLEDKWILSRYNRLVGEVRANLDSYELGVALSKLYDFIWDEFCDWYIELAKIRLADKESEGCRTAQNVLVYVLGGTMKLLHPFLPFITEEIWQSLPHEGDSIMISAYPEQSQRFEYACEEARMTCVIEAIKAIRRARADKNVPPSKKATVYIVTERKDVFCDATKAFFTRLASASSVEICDSVDEDNALRIITDSATIYIPLADIIDTEKELARLTKEKQDLLNEIIRLEKKLSNESFVSKAPAEVVEGERAKLRKYQDTLSSTEAALAQLK
ncbi:MAG: valine--tRNA ligase [Firmicutes bacterium]|nr:valine--tRNA ligase [Bacillota bacterium]